MILLDTDVCIALLRGVTHVLDRRLATANLIATTVITAGELRYGAAKSMAPARNQEIVSGFLRTMPVTGFVLPKNSGL